MKKHELKEEKRQAGRKAGRKERIIVGFAQVSSDVGGSF
jgi:hypothetical protein